MKCRRHFILQCIVRRKKFDKKYYYLSDSFPRTVFLITYLHIAESKLVGIMAKYFTTEHIHPYSYDQVNMQDILEVGKEQNILGLSR